MDQINSVQAIADAVVVRLRTGPGWLRLKFPLPAVHILGVVLAAEHEKQFFSILGRLLRKSRQKEEAGAGAGTEAEGLLPGL